MYNSEPCVLLPSGDQSVAVPGRAAVGQPSCNNIVYNTDELKYRRKTSIGGTVCVNFNSSMMSNRSIGMN